MPGAPSSVLAPSSDVFMLQNLYDDILLSRNLSFLANALLSKSLLWNAIQYKVSTSECFPTVGYFSLSKALL